jgi:hypothetical protein
MHKVNKQSRMIKFDRLDVDEVRSWVNFFFSVGYSLVQSVMLSAVVRYHGSRHCIERAFRLMLGMDQPLCPRMDRLLWHVHCTDTNQASCTLRNYGKKIL